jgi:hypothetical protein
VVAWAPREARTGGVAIVGHAAERKVGEAGDIGFYPRRAEPTKKGGKQRTRERGRLLLLRLKITSSSFIREQFKNTKYKIITTPANCIASLFDFELV